MSHRISQINDLVRDLVSRLIARELSLKSGVLVTLSSVDTSPDLRYTRVLVSVFPVGERDYAMKTLGHERRTLEKRLRELMSTRPLPRLEFVLDTTEEKAAEIEHILSDIEKEA